MSTEAGTIVLRPDWNQYGRWFGKGDPVLLGVVGVLLVGSVVGLRSGSSLAVLATVVTGSALVAMIGVTISIRTSKVLLTDETIEHRRWWVRATVLRTTDGLRGLLADYTPAFSGRSSDLLVLQRRDGGPRIRLNGAYWTRDDLVTIAERAGVPVLDQPMQARDFEERAPGIMYFRERRPWMFTVLGVVAVFVLAIAVAVLYVSVAG